MDIRSYFSVKKEKKVQENDSDVIPGTPEVKVKEKKSRKRRQITDDSDEETSQKKKSSKSSKDHNKSKKIKSPLKEVKACDIFSKSSIKRSDPLVKKTKKETEIVIHSDDEFEKTLLDLNTNYDTEESKKNNLCNSDNTENDKKSLEKHKHKLTQDEKHTKHDDIEASAIIDEHIEEVNKKARKRKPDEEQNGESKHKKDTPDKEEKIKDFKVFLENDDSLVTCDEIDRSVDVEPKRKKAKVDKSLNESVLSDEERHERKRYSAALYQKYLNRTGPKNLGSKEIPKGAPNCLQDCVFLLTGVLDSFERDEVVAAITEYGGVVKNGMSKKITHVLAGEDAGPAKIAKAQEFGMKILKEDDFLQMISDSLNSKSSRNNISEKKENKSGKKHEQRLADKKETDKKHEDKQNKKTKVENSVNGFSKDKKSINGTIKSETKVKEERKSLSPKKADKRDMNVKDKSKNSESRSETKIKVKEEKRSPKKIDKVGITEKVELKIKDDKVNIKDDGTLSRTMPSPSLMWVDKYKPQTVKQIIGQHGEASNVKKLTNWLTKWYANREAKLPKPSPWAKNDDGGYYKAALLSGPPGVGKTTTVSLVCKELGFDTVEFNASDTRSKTLIREQIGQLLTTSSLAGYAKGMTGKGAVSKKHVLVMDEVDGMAGNEDRGGLQELISLIKTSSVPIVCMCNDRNSDKMRTLVNYCYDLRFSRPRADQIKAAMMSICFKEGVKVPSDVMSAVISAAGQDVRQVLHLLAMWAADTRGPHSATPTKDVKMGPWEAIRKVFSAEEHKTMSMNDKSDLFFTDYSIMPLFVQENYLSAAPDCKKSEVLERISKAADSISLGDLVDARIRSGQAWSLLPVQAMYASVIPGHHMAGQLRAQIQFPGWLGRNSRAQRVRRLAQDIHAHTRLSTSGSKSSIFLDYAPHLRDAVVSPLVTEHAAGVDRALAVLEAYRLAKEDLDSLTEISLWPGQRNPMLLIDSKVKAAMTRAYNKKAAPLPYLPQAVKKGRTHDNDDEHFEGDEDDDNDDGDPENDVLIKKKKKEVEKPTKSKSKSSTSKKKK